MKKESIARLARLDRLAAAAAADNDDDDANDADNDDDDDANDVDNDHAPTFYVREIRKSENDSGCCNNDFFLRKWLP